MFTFFARQWLVATFIVVCLFLVACSKTPEGNPGAGRPPAQSANAVEPPTNIANGKQTTGERYEGFLDEADCNTIWGWAWNKNLKPNEAVYVEIWVDGVPVSTVPASQARWSVAKHTGDDGYHGFVYTVPPSLKDGKPHIIRARIAQTDSELQNGPKNINCPAP